MEKLQFSIDIAAPSQKVWEVLWGDDTYPRWTSVFSEGSRAETDWQEGSKVIFGDGTGSGMYSRIDRRVDNELMSFRHLGVVKAGEEQPADKESKEWENAMEIYRLEEKNGNTELRVELDATAEFKDYFSETFPKALQQVKKLSEG